MDTQNMSNNEQTEISIKELIQTVWKERIVVIIITSIIVIFSILYSFMCIKDVYKAEMEVIYKTPEMVVTRYGEYTPPSTSIKDYTSYIYSKEVIDEMYEIYGKDSTEYNLSKDSIKNMIEITANDSGVVNAQSSNYTLSIKSSDRELSEKMLNDLFEIYQKNLRIQYKLNAVSYFENTIQLDIGKLDSDILERTKTIEYNNELLQQMDPTVTVEKALLSDATEAGMYVKDKSTSLESLTDDIIVEEEINENYTMLQSKNAEVQAELNSFKGQLENDEVLYEELVSENSLINEVRNTDRENEIFDGRLDVFNGFVTSLSDASASDSAINGGKLLPVAMGVVLGIILGIFGAIFSNYWKTSN